MRKQESVGGDDEADLEKGEGNSFLRGRRVSNRLVRTMLNNRPKGGGGGWAEEHILNRVNVLREMKAGRAIKR